MNLNSVWNLSPEIRTNFLLDCKPEQVTEWVKGVLKKRPLSKSSLKEFAIGPRYYIEYLVSAKVDKEAWNLGKAVECLLLECKYTAKTGNWRKSKFDKQFIVADKPDLRKKDNKIYWNSLIEDAKKEKKTLISEAMYNQAELMALNTLENPNCAYFLDKKQGIQKKLNWVDKETGLEVIGYIDFEVDLDGHKVIIDNKQSKCKTPDEFNKDVYNLRYDLQIGSYLLAYHKQRFEFPDFMFMVSTNVFPYDSYMVHVPPKLIDDSKEEFAHMLKAFKYCLDNNQFHMGADFWLFDTMQYHSLEKPRYFKSKRVND